MVNISRPSSNPCPLLRRTSRNGVIFDQEVVLKPKRTVMCLFPEGGIDAAELVEAANNEEVRVRCLSTHADSYLTLLLF